MSKEDVYTAMYDALRLVADSGSFECFDDAAWDIINDALDKADNIAFVPSED